jgi:putative copper export protein
MLTVSWDTIRLFLHILAATVWVGGQITLLGLLPTLRAIGPDAPRLAARRFNLIAWAAFAVLVVTGIWNILAINIGNATTAYQVTLMIKLTVVFLSGAGAAFHTLSRSKAALAIGGALGLLGALAAVFLGILLAGH